MNRKSRPLKSDRGDLLRSIDQRIYENELIKEDISEEIQRYIKMCLKNDAKLSGIDYSRDKILGGSVRVDFQTAIQRIDSLKANLNKVLEENRMLKRKKKKLIEIYQRDQTVEAKVFFYREILEYSQEMTAAVVGYSVRQIQRIEKKLREQGVSESDT